MKRVAYFFLITILLFNVDFFSNSHAQFVAYTKASEYVINLNGNWQFNANPPSKFWLQEQALKNWPSIEVPGEWLMQGFKVDAGKMAAYARSVEVPANWSDKTIYLRCDAVFSNADIWINGKKAGTHIGPMVAFELNVTDLIKHGKQNRIDFGVTSETLSDTLMSGTQYAAHQLGGILRKVTLVAIPKVHVGDLIVDASLDDRYTNGALTLSGSIRNFAKTKKVVLHARLFGPNNQEINLNEDSVSLDLDKEKLSPFRMQFTIPKALKWDAEHPNLYRVELDVQSSQGLQKINQRVGFRKIEVVGNQLFVNGSPVKLKGVNRHETHPLRGRSLTPELWKKDAELYKKANLNYIRTSHYPPSEEFIELCDELGLYVELENPISWVGHHANEHWLSHDPKDPSLYPYFEHIAKSNIAFFRNHPSVLIWSMVNESMWTKNWDKLADFYAKEDSTRPATFHDQAYGGFNNYGSTKMPVANIHYPGTRGPQVAEDFERPLLFGEYAHLNTYNREEIVTDPGVRDAWGRGFRKMWEGMYKSRGCVGGAIWSGIDDVFYLPDGRAVGYGEWGPIDGWRREKPEYFHMKKSYSPVKIHNRNVPVPMKGKPVRLQVENRFDFTNMNECEIHWTLGDQRGTVGMELPAGDTGILDIYPQGDDLDGKILTVRVISPQKIEVEACAIEIGNVKRDDFPFQKLVASPFNISESNEQLNIAGEGFDWLFDLSEGSLKGASVNGESVLTSGAELMMLDLRTGPCNTEHSLEIPFHNSICSGKKVHGVSWKQQSDTIKVSVQVSYDQAQGAITYSFTNNGTVTVVAQMKSKVKMNPRQWGLVFSVPNTSENLQWYRRGLWSWYPADHIGRTNGQAVPFGEEAFHVESFGQMPQNHWRFDAVSLGTNDFRATRENIYWAALSNANGNGITVVADGEQAFRSFVDGEDKISFLVAGYSTGGGDLFFSGHYNDERIKLQEGSEMELSVKLQLVKK